MIAKKNKKIIFLAAVVFLFFVVVIFSDLKAALAEEGFGSMSGYLNDIATNVDLKKASVPTMIGKIIYGILGLLGVFSLLLVIYAGLKWMLADGNEETVSQSKKIILYAIIGVLIIMGSYAVTYYVVDRIVSSSLQSGSLDIPIEPQNLGPGQFRDNTCSGNGDCESGYECINGFCIPSRLDYVCNNPSDCAIYCSGTQTATCENHICGCADNYCDNLNCLRNCRAQGYTSGYCDSGNNCECT